MKKILILIVVMFSYFTQAQAPEVDYLMFNKYTTAQRDAIPVSDTSVTYFIENTDTDMFQVNRGSGWVDLFSSAGSDNLGNHIATQNLDIDNFRITAPNYFPTGNIYFQTGAVAGLYLEGNFGTSALKLITANGARAELLVANGLYVQNRIGISSDTNLTTNTGNIQANLLTATRTYELPDADGTLLSEEKAASLYLPIGGNYVNLTGVETISGDKTFAANLRLSNNFPLLIGDTGSGTLGETSSLFADGTNTIWRLFDGDLILRDGTATERFRFTRTTGDLTATTFNGVPLETGGSSSEYLNRNGTYSTPAGGGGASNLTEVSNLTELQAVVDGTGGIRRTVSITGAVDLVNTNVTLTNVYLADGGGTIITSGTGELEILGDSYVANALLNYQLNWASTTTAKLVSKSLILDLVNFPLDQTISTSISFSGVIAGDITKATNNRDYINKAINDSKLLSGDELYIPVFDGFINNAPTNGVDLASYNLVETHGFAIQIPSDYTIRMNNDVFIRSLPSNTYSQNIISSLETKNPKIIGGNLIGSRTTHNYQQKRLIYTASTGTSIDYTVGENDDLTTFTVTITANDKNAQAQEISDAINANGTLTGKGFSSTYSGDAFFISNSTDGIFFRAYSDATNSFSESLTAYDITYELGVAFIGVINGTVEGTTIKDCYGDGMVAAGNGLSTAPGYINSQNIILKNCTLDNNRRNNVSPVGVDGMRIENNYIINAGQDDGVNLGSAPRLGVDTEPTRFRDATTGATLDENIVRGVLVLNNYMLDNLYGSVNLFSAYDSWAKNNVVNTRIAAQKQQGGGLLNNVVNYNLSLGGAIDAIGQVGIQITAVEDVWTNKIEIASEIEVSGNIVYGKGASATLAETGASIEGWKINFNNNTFKNINGQAIKLFSLRESNVTGNIVTNESSNTDSEGIAIESAAVRDVTISGNKIDTYNYALNITNINTDALATAISMAGTPSLIIDNNTFKSENLETRLRIAERVIVKNNVFKSHLHINNVNSNLKFFNNIFEDGIDFGGTSAAQNNIQIINNYINSTNTDAGLEIETRGASSGVYIADNTFNQASGARALYIRNNGAQPDGFVLKDNDLEAGSPTEFVTFAGDNSLIYNNIDVTGGTAVLSQTITGTGNSEPALGGGGVTDHGALTGLADDDHPQYLTQAEGDGLYQAIGGGSSFSDKNITTTTFTDALENNVLSVTIPANTFGVVGDKKILKVVLSGGFDNTSGSNQNFTYRVDLGSTAVYEDVVTASNNASYELGYHIELFFMLDGGTGTVKMLGSALIDNPIGGATVGEGDLNYDEGRGNARIRNSVSADTTTALDLNISWQGTGVTNSSVTSYFTSYELK